MTFIREAAKWYASEPHQDQAWDALEAELSQYLLDKFKEAYRAKPEPPAAPPEKKLITKEVFSKLTGYSAHLFTDQEVDDCNRLLKETGFDQDIEASRMLMANILHETANLKYMKEIASGVAYNNRSDLGNGPTDGPVYKGAGVLQLTGKYNYSRLSKALNDPRVMEGVDYVSTTYPFMSAKTWIIENNLLHIAQTRGFDAVCRRINGGWNGYEDRLAKYRTCQRVLK